VATGAALVSSKRYTCPFPHVLRLRRFITVGCLLVEGFDAGCLEMFYGIIGPS